MIVRHVDGRKRFARCSPIIPSHGSPDAHGDTRNGTALRKRRCGGDSCWRPADNDRANDERTNHLNRVYSVDDDEHRDDCDDDGDDNLCGDYDDAGCAEFPLVTASEDDSYSRSSSWSERVRYAIWERSTGASAPQEASAPSLEAAHGYTAPRSGQVHLSRRRCVGLRRFLRRVPRRRSREVAPWRRHLRRARHSGRSGRERNDQPRRLAQGRRLAALGTGCGSEPVLLRASLGICPWGVPLTACESRRRTRLHGQHR